MHYMPYNLAFTVKPWMDSDVIDVDANIISANNISVNGISPYNTVNLAKTTDYSDSEKEISCDKFLEHLNNCSNCQLKLADQIANNAGTSVETSKVPGVSNVIEKFSNSNSKNTIDTVIVFCLLLITLWVFVVTRKQ